jgi:hypothetical protein
MEDAHFDDLDWSCGARARLTRAQVHAILSNATYTLRSWRSADPAVVATAPSPVLGTVIFGRTEGRWRPMFLAEGSTIEGALSTPDQSRILIVSLWSREGGGSLTVASYDWRDGSVSCAELTTPPDLNKPYYQGEYAALERLEMDAHGHGQLLARANIDAEGAPSERIYAYKTRNYGQAWTAPVRLAHLPPARNVLAGSKPRAVERSLAMVIEADSGN